MRPGWLALALMVVMFAYLCFTVLAPWQLGKNTDTSRENRQIQAALDVDPVPVRELLPQQDSDASQAQWRKVTATGRYLPAAQVLARLRVVDGAPAYEVLIPFAVEGGPTVLVNRGYVRPAQGTAVPDIPAAPSAPVTITARLRVVDGAPAYEVLTPFAVEGGPTVLVNRGYVRPAQGTAVPDIPAAPSAPVTITARLRDSESMPPADKAPFRESGFMQVYAINAGQIADVTGIPLTGSYLQLVENQPGGLGVPPLPILDAGPFLSYGIQWIAFGIVAPIGLGYLIFAELRMRRREAAARAESAVAAEPLTVEEKLADRYGRRR